MKGIEREGCRTLCSAIMVQLNAALNDFGNDHFGGSHFLLNHDWRESSRQSEYSSAWYRHLRRFVL